MLVTEMFIGCLLAFLGEFALHSVTGDPPLGSLSGSFVASSTPDYTRQILTGVNIIER